MLNDLDIAVFQESEEPYLQLAMKYRRKTRSIASKIPIDIFPVNSDADSHSFLTEITSGEVIYGPPINCLVAPFSFTLASQSPRGGI